MSETSKVIHQVVFYPLRAGKIYRVLIECVQIIMFAVTACEHLSVLAAFSSTL